MTRTPNTDPAFDHYAASYDEDLNYALAVTGAEKDFFAQNRIAWLAGCLHSLSERPQNGMDYGCGNGSSSPLLLSTLGLDAVVGVDVSPAIIAKARESYEATNIRFSTVTEPLPSGDLDLVYCNGVFHHIDNPGRVEALQYVSRALRVGGLFSLWENNPWNPATRYIMSRCAFDEDAQMLNVVQTKRLLQRCGFTIVRVDFLFIFPEFLKALRPLERWVSSLPIGGQYQVLARKDRLSP